MRIAAIGWYFARNAGDDRILAGLRALLAGHAVVPIDVDGIWAPEDLSGFDFVLLGGGGLWHREIGHFRVFHQWEKRLRPPLGVIGLGVDEMVPAMRKATAALLHRALFVAVRDRRSAALLGDHFKVLLAPDLSWLAPLPPYPPPPDGPVALNLRPWTRTPWDPAGWAREAAALGRGVRPLPLHLREDGDRAFLARFLPDVPAAFDEADVARARLVVTMRLHGVHFALQARRPFICLAYHPKCENLLADIGLADLALPLDAPGRLRPLARRLESNYDAEVARIDRAAAGIEREARAVYPLIRTLIERHAR